MIMRNLTKSWGLGDSGDTSIYTEVGLEMGKTKGSIRIYMTEIGEWFLYYSIT
jgi:hypothetical protein